MRILALFLLVICTLIFSPAFAQEEQPPWPTGGWSTSTPEAQGMDSEKLARAFTFIQDQGLDIHSLLVIRNGYLVAEGYDEFHTADTRHRIYSCTKSFTSALIGITIEQGYITGVDEPILSFFPDYTPANLDEIKESITVEDLLTMSSGLDWPGGILEPLLDDLWSSNDWVQFVLDRPMAEEPGTHYVYNSGGSNLLAAIVAQSTGQTAYEFAQTNLFEPLGITNLRWETDPQGRYLGGWGLYLTPRDMAKFGYLYLNEGQWDGQQVVPSNWVETSTTRHIAATPLSDEYGYQWWVDNQGYYMALGYGGQYIIVKPDENLVVVFTSALSPEDFSMPEMIFLSFILKAVQSGEALRENPAGIDALQEAVDAFANPPAGEVSAVPEMVETISGQTYQLDSNNLGWRTFALHVSPELDTVELLVNGSFRYMVGLDGRSRASPIDDVGMILLKGSWLNEDRLVIEGRSQGSADRLRLTITFIDDTARFVLRRTEGQIETFSGQLSG